MKHRILRAYAVSSFHNDDWESCVKWTQDNNLHFQDENGHFICDLQNAPFDIKDIVESVGRCDDNDVLVFTEDIIKYKNGNLGVVSFDYYELYYYAQSTERKDLRWNLADSLNDGAVVVGNTIQNPDILKV